MRILFVGDSLSEQYVRAFYREAKNRKNIIAELFDYEELNNKNIITRIELHYKIGVMIGKLNKRLTNVCVANRYDLVFIYYSTLLYGETVKKIRNTGAKVFMYCNDNPFSLGYKKYVWRHLINQIPYCDLIYSYRESNIDDYKRNGAQYVKLMLPYYIKERNYYIPDIDIELSVPNVVYIGHNEDDGRDAYIKALLKEGIDIGLNYTWAKFCKDNLNVEIFEKDVATKRYNEILNKAKIAVVFLSQLNGDSYTRRCFEIPAVKTMMLAPYTEDLAKMYEENAEIVFFRNKEDFVKKIKYYISHPSEREQIAERGYAKLMKSHNDISDRLDEVIDDYCAFK